MTRTPLPVRRSSVAAALALATLALYGLGNLAGLAHLALERHRVCLEHGELVHAGPFVAQAAGAQLPADRPALAGGFEPEGGGHHHCAIADHLRQAGLSPAPAELAPALPPADRTPACPPDRAHHPIAALTLSPKHSPPATA